MKRNVIAAGLACSLVGTGCAESLSYASKREEPVFQQVYEHDDSKWTIECFGPIREVEARAGDILLRLILNNTDVRQPAALGRLDIPQEVVVEAIADMNGLVNPDQITAGHDYRLPSHCQQQ